MSFLARRVACRIGHRFAGRHDGRISARPNPTAFASICKRKYATFTIQTPPLWANATGTIARVLNEGDNVQEDGVVATVEIDKLTFDVRSPVSGTVHKCLVRQNEVVRFPHPIVVVRGLLNARDRGLLPPGSREVKP